MYKIRSYIFHTNKYLLVGCRAASASSSKYGMTSSIFYFITFPGSLLWIVSMSCSWMSLRVFTNLLTTSSSAIMSKNSGRYQTYMYIDLLFDVDNVVRFFIVRFSFVRLHLSMLYHLGHLSIGLSISINASVFSHLGLKPSRGFFIWIWKSTFYLHKKWMCL